MGQLLRVLFATAVLLAVIALFGHGLWLLAALIVRALSGAASPPSAAPRQPGAGAASAPPERPTPTLMGDLDATARQLDRFREQGAIDGQTHQQLMTAVNAHRLRLLHGQAPTTATAPSPTAQPVLDASVLESIEPEVPAAVAPEAPPPTQTTPTPRRSIYELLAGFMHERNIQWGELVAGLIIVFCSAALVISLWQQITAYPVGKFAIFIGVNTAIFGAGLFSHHRWNLPTTSRGLLIIATLLVPLNFLAIAALTEGRAPASAGVFGGEALAIGLFAVLLFMAGRVLTPVWPALLTVGVLLPSVGQLLVRRFVGAETSTGAMVALSVLPLAGYVGAVGAAAARAWRWRAFGRAKSDPLLALLGLATFSAVMPLGLLAYKSGAIVVTLRDLAVVVSVHALPALTVGLLLWQRVKSTRMAAVRTAGTSIAIAAAFVLMLGLVLAWPRPVTMLTVALCDFAVLTAGAVMFAMPAAHVAAAACLGAAYLVTFHALGGRVEWGNHDGAALLRALMSAASGTALSPLAAALGGAAGALARWKRRADARWYALAAAIAAGLSVVLVTCYGFGRTDDGGATWVYAAYAAGALVAAQVLRRPGATWAGMALALTAIVQAVVFRYADALALAEPMQVALLAFASTAVVAATAVAMYRRRDRGSDVGGDGGGDRNAHRVFVQPLMSAALFTSLAAAVLIVLATSIPASRMLAWRTLWLAGVWCVIAAWSARPAIFTLVQAALAWALGLAVTAWLARHGWFAAMRFPMLDVRTIQALAIAQTLLLLAWVAARLALWRWLIEPPSSQQAGDGDDLAPAPAPAPMALSTPAWSDRLRRIVLANAWSWHFESRLGAVLLGAAAWLGLRGVWPGIVQELAPSDRVVEALTELSAYWHAFGPASWALVALLILLFIAAQWERYDARRLRTVLIALWVACLLIAGPWEAPAFSTASALRWVLAMYWLIGSAALGSRRTIGRRLEALRWPDFDAQTFGSSRAARVWLIALTVAPVLLLTLYPLLAVVAGEPLRSPQVGTLFARIGPAAAYSVPLVMLSAGLWGYALRRRSPGYTCAATLALNAAATSWWVMYRWLIHVPDSAGAWVDLVNVNTVAMAGGGLLAAALPALAQRWSPADSLQHEASSATQPAQVAPAHWWFHRSAALGACGAVTVMVLIGLAADAASWPLDNLVGPAWAALLVTAALMFACLWDRRATFALPAMFVMDLCLIGLVIDRLDLRPAWLMWDLTVAGAGYAWVIAVLWRLRDHWLPAVADAGLPLDGESDTPGSAGLGRVLSMAVDLCAVVVVGALWVSLGFKAAAAGVSPAAAMWLRLAVATVALSQGAAAALLADEPGATATPPPAPTTPTTPTPRRIEVRSVALWLGAVAAVAWAWSWLDPRGPSDNVLNRAVLVMTALGAASAFFGLVPGKLMRVTEAWAEAVRRTLPMLMAIATAALLVVMFAEVMYFVGGAEVPMAWSAIVVVALTLASAGAVAVLFAAVPGRDPLRFSERGRMAYVYAAEVMLALLFLHIRLTMPWLFRGFFTKYWPLIVMLLAFGGVGLGELFRRQRRMVLAQPLERTAVFLPLLPVLGFWMGKANPIFASRVDYSFQLLLVGLLYAMLSIARRSFKFGMLAALAANGGLWYFLHRQNGFGFLEHPQLWLIPAALSVLVAGHLNRKRLSDEQMTSLRYTCLIIVYISSTADIFIAGVANSPWLPLVLGGLSVAGVFAGIAMRVRSFLFLGMAFLLLSLITMVWHASANLGWTWLWWVAGIAMGLAIFALFALFEKKRAQMLELVGGLKQWQA